MSWGPRVLVQRFAITISLFTAFKKRRLIWFPSARGKASHLTDIRFVILRSSTGENENALF